MSEVASINLMQPKWSAEMDALLLDSRLKLGLSFSQTSRRLTKEIGREITRSACICRARRKGMGRQGHSPVIDQKALVRRLDARREPPPATEAISTSEPISTPHARPWTERVEGECKWPLSDDGPPALWRSCCAPVSRSGYCEDHHRVMFNPREPA